MSELLNADGFRFVCYMLASTTALAAFGYERHLRQQTGTRTLWSTFWLLQALLLVAMGLASAYDAADALSDLARERARSERWYLDRRSFQVPVVAAILMAWMVITVLAIWRVPPRRRRYLPSAALLGALISFAAIRTVSLHHVDTLLYRRELSGIRVVSVAEIALLAAVTIAVAVSVGRPGSAEFSVTADSRSSAPRSTEARSGRPTE